MFVRGDGFQEFRLRDVSQYIRECDLDDTCQVGAYDPLLRWLATWDKREGRLTTTWPRLLITRPTTEKMENTCCTPCIEAVLPRALSGEATVSGLTPPRPMLARGSAGWSEEIRTLSRAFDGVPGSSSSLTAEAGSAVEILAALAILRDGADVTSFSWALTMASESCNASFQTRPGL